MTKICSKNQENPVKSIKRIKTFTNLNPGLHDLQILLDSSWMFFVFSSISLAKSEKIQTLGEIYWFLIVLGCKPALRYASDC